MGCSYPLTVGGYRLGSGGMSTDQIDFDTTLELSSAVQRRIILAVFAQEQRPLTSRDLAQAVLTHHSQGEEEADEVFRRLLVSLHHIHLPKLEDAGIIEYDQRRRKANPAKWFDQLWPSLSAIIDLDPNLNLPLEF